MRVPENVEETSQFEALAFPTKRLFIEMMIKDVDLTDAINDLTDNSVDGAKRLRQNDDGDDSTYDSTYDGLYIHLTLAQDRFVIKDNCGGMSLDDAINKAFKFGRPPGADNTKHSVGRFGIGMKRALFKLGRYATIETVHKAARFRVVVDVEEWSRDDTPSTWKFPILDLQYPPEGSQYEASELGTTITVTNLHDEVARRFQDGSYVLNFETRLKDAHTQFISRGLEIRVNNKPRLLAETYRLLQSMHIKPAHEKMQVPAPGSDKVVTIRMYAGVGSKKEAADLAGWYVFCNGRQILRADRSDAVGWGTPGIPRFHNQYKMFRGYAFFDCDDADALPWNTTKTALDREAPVYLAARPELIKLTDQVVDFIDKLDRENDQAQHPLGDAVEDAKPMSIDSLPENPNFDTPEPDAIIVTKLVRISYQREAEEVNRVRDALAKMGITATKPTDVGRETFQYFVDTEL